MVREFRIKSYASGIEGGSLDQIIQFLEKEKEDYGKTYSNLRLEYVDVSEWHAEYCRYECVLFGTREETEIEKRKREENEQAAQQRREGHERKIYEELKKKFEK